MLVNYYTLLNLLQQQNNTRLINSINTLQKKSSYIDFSEVIHFIENEEELESTILSLKYKGIMFIKDGIVRILVNWESHYKSDFKTFISKNKLFLDDDYFDLNDDQVNLIRKVLREKDYYQYLKLSTQNYFTRLKKIKEHSVDLKKAQPVDFIELKDSTLSNLEIVLYV